MKFAITQFTFDPKNFVNVSQAVKDDLEKIVNNKVFKKLKINSKYAEWELVYVISSHEDYSKKLTPLLEPMKSYKHKTLSFYIYFPRLKNKKKYGTYAYDLEKFIDFFFKSLAEILSTFEVGHVDLKQISDSVKEKWLENPNAIYDEDDIILTPAEIKKILREK